MIDQTITGIWAAEHGYDELDDGRYAVRPVESLDGVVARHYYSKTRDLMYVEGIRTLRKTTNILARQKRSLIRALIPKALIPVLSRVKKKLPLWAVKILVDLTDRPTGISKISRTAYLSMGAFSSISPSARATRFSKVCSVMSFSGIKPFASIRLRYQDLNIATHGNSR